MGNYTSGSEATLPADTTDLTDHTLDATDLTAVSSNDNSSYVGQLASGEYAIFMFKDTVTGTSVDLTWSGKTDLAPSTSPVQLQIYNHNTDEWETVDVESAESADTDFNLTKTITSTTNYLDGGVMTCRVYQNYAYVVPDHVWVSTPGGPYWVNNLGGKFWVSEV